MGMKVRAIFFAAILALSLGLSGTTAFAADVQASHDEAYAQAAPKPPAPAPKPVGPTFGSFGVTWED